MRAALRCVRVCGLRCTNVLLRCVRCAQRRFRDPAYTAGALCSACVQMRPVRMRFVRMRPVRRTLIRLRPVPTDYAARRVRMAGSP